MFSGMPCVLCVRARDAKPRAQKKTQDTLSQQSKLSSVALQPLSVAILSFVRARAPGDRSCAELRSGGDLKMKETSVNKHTVSHNTHVSCQWHATCDGSHHCTIIWGHFTREVPFKVRHRTIVVQSARPRAIPRPYRSPLHANKIWASKQLLACAPLQPARHEKRVCRSWPPHAMLITAGRAPGRLGTGRRPRGRLLGGRSATP